MAKSIDFFRISGGKQIAKGLTNMWIGTTVSREKVDEQTFRQRQF
jgi:hypothetical protein